MMERRTKRWIHGVYGVALVSPLVLEENGAFQFKTHLTNQLRFSGLPKLPDFPINQGPEVFNRVVVHSMDYSAMEDASAAELINGKRVVVVGNQKSGLDIAVECASANGAEHPCTLIYRTKHWGAPNFVVWGVSLALLYFNRFSELMLHKPGALVPAIGASGFVVCKRIATDLVVWFSLRFFASLGAAEAGLTGSNMARRIADIEEFEFKIFGENHNQGVGLCGFVECQPPKVVNIVAVFSFDSVIGRSTKTAIEAAIYDIYSDPSILKVIRLNTIIKNSKCIVFNGAVEGIEIACQLS
ncbi:hypothetical protein Syun_011761 [Stephania yunnanensis]|uniref:Flavin-containing monooxygenase n=1 Tax=Stephania yunnanensis TaxID=152371 RepID=A0AAP0PIT2_9MAGN